jgi:hypothetical protein
MITRRLALLLPFALTACGDDEESDDTAFAPLRYGYLPPIQLNVASIEIQQRFIPGGVAPDVSASDPAPPVQVLHDMGQDRLQAFGISGKAVFAILNAALTRVDDVIRGEMAVSLTIYNNDGVQQGFAEAHVDRTHTGDVKGLRRVLYDMTKAMMDDMNVEFEYQVRHNLKPFLTTATAPDAPVQQDPLNQPPTN